MNKYVYTAKDISELLGISLSKSYSTIRVLNDELQKKGFLTFAGKVSIAYFNERVFGMKGGDENGKMESN